MPPTSPDTTEIRFALLERSNRRLRLALSLLTLAGAALLLMGQSGATREGRYQLFEKEGNEAIMWDTVTGEVRVYNLQNQDRVSIDRAWIW